MNLPQPIIDLIHKLANITVANGSNPNEEAFAARALQRLLAEHQLSMSDVPNK